MQFKMAKVTVPFDDQQLEYEFMFRDPLEWALALVADPLLASTHIWYPTCKYYCENGREDELIDETSTGKRLWDIQVSTVVADLSTSLINYFHQTDISQFGPNRFALGIQIWLDKARVTKKVRMHPIVARPLWQPSNIRNASGNGGGILLGYMPIASTFCHGYVTSHGRGTH